MDLEDPVFVIGRGELVPITKTVVIEDGDSSYTTSTPGESTFTYNADSGYPGFRSKAVAGRALKTDRAPLYESVCM